MKVFTETGCDCCTVRMDRALQTTIKLQMMPWCKILKSQTTIFLPSSTAATSGLVSLAAPVLREKCISALRNVHNSQKSTLVNLPAVTVLQILGIDAKKIKEGHPNPQSSSTERETIAGMFALLQINLKRSKETTSKRRSTSKSC